MLLVVVSWYIPYIFALRLLPLVQGQWPNGKNKASLGPFSQYLNIDPARPIEAALIVEPALATEPALAE